MYMCVSVNVRVYKLVCMCVFICWYAGVYVHVYYAYVYVYVYVGFYLSDGRPRVRHTALQVCVLKKSRIPSRP